MIPVLIESPYAGKSPPQTFEYDLEVRRNLRYLRSAMRDCLKRGEAPFASHALYTQKGVLDDTVAEERSLGIEAGLIWGAFAEKTVVYTDLGMSGGMTQGIARAKAEYRPIEYRSLPEWKNPLLVSPRVCTTPTGRTDCHGDFVILSKDKMTCSFCGEPA